MRRVTLVLPDGLVEAVRGAAARDRRQLSAYVTGVLARAVGWAEGGGTIPAPPPGLASERLAPHPRPSGAVGPDLHPQGRPGAAGRGCRWCSACHGWYRVADVSAGGACPKCGGRWRDWDRESEPLGCLSITSQYEDQPLKTDKGDAVAELVSAPADEIDRLRRENWQLTEQLTVVQTRCTELKLELRNAQTARGE